MLKDKVIIVSGVGPGMTRGFVNAAAREGAKVVVTARTQSFIEQVVSEVREAGGVAIAVPTDVTKTDECRRAAAEALSAFGRIDGLVNSAFAYPPYVPIGEADLEAWKGAYDVICLGALRMIQSVLPTMREQKSGSIVNVSSMSTRHGYPGAGGYAHAKAALNQITRDLSVEEGPNNIRVNTAAIGYMMGASLQKNYLDLLEPAEREKLLAEIVSRIPLGHVPPDKDCAKPLLFLLSDYASEVTGAILDVNGGEWPAI